jgi:hopanoid-associated phosphorylase
LIIGAVTAMAREARLVRRSASRTESMSAVILSAGGIGPERAGNGARALVERGAALLLSTGYAGGLAAGLKAGDLLIPETIVDEAGDSCATWAPGREQVHRTLAGFGRQHAGALMSCTKVVASVEEKRALARTSGALGVDMESAAVAAVGREFGVPVLVLRSVSDSADRRLPHVALASTGIDGRMSVPGLLGALARRPWELPALIRLARDVGAADRALEKALVNVLPLLVGTRNPPVGRGGS